VLGKRCVSAILWRLFVLMLLLTLTLNKMVSVLLKSQVQQAQSIAGCQMSLEPKSILWLSADRIQGSNAKQLLDAFDICISSQHLIYLYRKGGHVHCGQQSHLSDACQCM